MSREPSGQRHTPELGKRPSAEAFSRWENEGGATKKRAALPKDTVFRAGAAMREAAGKKPAKKR
jgi:hypothetical protein